MYVYIMYVYMYVYNNIYVYILADRWSRTNPKFEQTQSSNKSKLRTNPNFE